VANLDWKSGRLSQFILFCGVLILQTGPAIAGPAFGEDTWNIKLGGFLSEFDTEVGVTGPLGGNPKIDLEDKGLDSEQSAFRGQIMWRFAPRHRIILDYYRFDRTATNTLEGQIEINDPDDGLIVFDAGISLDSEFDWELIPLSYAYSFYKTKDMELAASLGLHWVDVSLSFSGVATLNGTENQFVSESEAVSGPLPVVGIRGDYAITPHWLVGGHAQYFGLDYDDYSGDLVDVRLQTEYWFTDSFGAGLGYTWYQIDLTKDLGSSFNMYVDYRYSGLEAYVGFRF
jgi:hypothetical protein